MIKSSSVLNVRQMLTHILQFRRHQSYRQQYSNHSQRTFYCLSSKVIRLDHHHHQRCLHNHYLNESFMYPLQRPCPFCYSLKFKLNFDNITKNQFSTHPQTVTALKSKKNDSITTLCLILSNCLINISIITIFNRIKLKIIILRSFRPSSPIFW